MDKKFKNMRAIIIGCGAIGGHIAYCLYERGFDVLIIAKQDTYERIKKNGLRVQINKNKKILKNKCIKVNNRFNVYRSLGDLKGLKIDFIFITVKLKDYNNRLIKTILKLVDKNTAIIPPCTNIPMWWINNFFKNKIKNKRKNYFKTENIIGMTMWLSSEKKTPNKILVKHIQRGYPLKAISTKMNKKADKLRSVFKSVSKSPLVKNIYSEIYIKSLNALAFNMAALYYQQNNKSLKKNKKAMQMVGKIMLEGEKIMNSLKIKHHQNYKERINQTLSSSVHTMSMLTDFKKRKELELKYLWGSFDSVSKISKIKMPFSKNIYTNLIKKLKIK